MITSMKLDLFQVLKNNLVDPVRQTAARWTTRLYAAATQNREKWLRETRLLEEECIKLHADFRWVGSKPSKFINSVPREVVQIIDEYDKNNVLHLTTADTGIHKHVCLCMLEAALFPGIMDWNIITDTSEFTEELMVLLLPCLSDMKCLRAAQNMPRRCSWLLTNNTGTLKRLQEFYFPIACSKQV